MIRRSAIAGVFAMTAPFLGMMGLGGCADLMQRSQAAPEWFQAKAKEFQGQGYPDLSKIPAKRGTNADQPAWDAAAASLSAKVAEINAAAASAPPIPTPEEDRAMAAQWRALVEKGTAAPDGKPPAGF
jgi:hypothetical protein